MAELTRSSPGRALVLGGYGMIGTGVMRALRDAGYEVTGLGRSAQRARVADPDASWAIHDMPELSVADWRVLLKDTDVVVNAAGALQDGAHDSLEAIHVTAILRLAEAAADLPVRIVQISAAGATEAASTPFLRSKARGDAGLAARCRNHVILRPALVLAPEAYGGTALLRAVAACPLVLPVALPDARVQIVHIDDLTDAVVRAARGDVPAGTVADLAEPDSHAFPDLVAAFRRWMGFSEPVMRIAIPAPILSAASAVADLLGHLGWRSPLRRNALRTLRDGVRADPAPWTALTGRTCRSLAASLAQMPATRQERLFARAYLVLPLAIATLSLFWIVSGLVTLAAPARAATVLTEGAWPAGLAMFTVLAGAAADIGLGGVVLWRRMVRPAAVGMILLSAAYLAGSLIAAPDLWSDPLGPMVKVFPGMALAAMVRLMVEAP